MKGKTIKFIGIFFILLVIVDLVLFVLGKINTYFFWLVIIISAVVAYKVLPKLRTN